METLNIRVDAALARAKTSPKLGSARYLRRAHNPIQVLKGVSAR